VRDIRGHYFRALRAGVHVAVMACLIAQFADVDLQRGRFHAQYLRYAIFAQRLRESFGITVAAGKYRKWRIRNGHQQHPLLRSPGEQQSAGASVVRE